MSSVVTRFAPSPTGYLHIGNARTALLCALLVKKFGGTLILRIDDTDLERSRPEYEQGIIEDLTRLGVTWGRFFRQSERLQRYEQVKEQLKASGRLYECFETPEEIETKRKTLLARGLPPIYDREALRLNETQKQALRDQGRKSHWRFKLSEEKPVAWNDLIRGDITFDPRRLSDPVLIRENGAPTYMLPSAVDDADYAVTHVLRGEDHITNTAVQVQIFEALGAPVPLFAHLSLVQAMEGKMSKRKGGFDIRTMLQEEGVEPEALISYLARVGTSAPVTPFTSLEEAAEGFDFGSFSRSSCKFDREELDRLNVKIIRQLSWEQAAPRVAPYGADQGLWEAAKGNLEKISEITAWAEICRSPVTPVIEDPEFAAQAAALLPPEPWDHTVWKTWTAQVGSASGRKGKGLYLPLRLALTALSSGPELDVLLPLIGEAKAKARLQGKAA